MSPKNSFEVGHRSHGRMQSINAPDRSTRYTLKLQSVSGKCILPSSNLLRYVRGEFSLS